MSLLSGVRSASQRFQVKVRFDLAIHQTQLMIGQYYVASDVCRSSHLNIRHSLLNRTSVTWTAHHQRSPLIEVHHKRIHSTSTSRFTGSTTVQEDREQAAPPRNRPQPNIKNEPHKQDTQNVQTTLTHHSQKSKLALLLRLSNRKRRQALALFEADLIASTATRADCEAVFNTSLGANQQMNIIARLQSEDELKKLSSRTFIDFLATLLVFNRKDDVVTWRLQMTMFGIADTKDSRYLMDPHRKSLAELRAVEMIRFVQLDTPASLEAAWELFEALEPPPTLSIAAATTTTPPPTTTTSITIPPPTTTTTTNTTTPSPQSPPPKTTTTTTTAPATTPTQRIPRTTTTPTRPPRMTTVIAEEENLTAEEVTRAATRINRIRNLNVMMFNTLLKACLNLEQREIVLTKMKQFGLQPSTPTFNVLLVDSLLREGYDGFQAVLAEMEAAGLAPDKTTETMKGLASRSYTTLNNNNTNNNTTNNNNNNNNNHNADNNDDNNNNNNHNADNNNNHNADNINNNTNDLNERRARLIKRLYRKGVVGITEVWRLYNLWLEDDVKPNFDVHIAMLRACTSVDEQLTKVVAVAAVDTMSPSQRAKFFRPLIDLTMITCDDHATVQVLRTMSEYDVVEREPQHRSQEVLQDMQGDLMEIYFEWGDVGRKAAFDIIDACLDNGTCTAEHMELVIHYSQENEDWDKFEHYATIGLSLGFLPEFKENRPNFTWLRGIHSVSTLLLFASIPPALFA